MCADSMCSTGDLWWPSTKIFNIHGSLVGCAGESQNIRQFVDWMREGRPTKRPKLGANFCALVMTSNKLEYWFEDLIPEPIERGFHAIGSGGNSALGAMKNGADITTAVRIACEIDPGSREPILYERLHNADPKTV